VYQIFSQISIGHFDIVAFLVAVIVGVLLVVLYPNKSELWMSNKTVGGMAARKM
jgi:hypothetical protein